MKLTLIAAASVAVVTLTIQAATVSAHASLTRCSIKNNQVFRVGHSPRQVTATFAEPLDPATSWVKVFEGQADHGFVEKQTFSVSLKDPKQMILRLPKLIKEKYYLVWYTHSSVDNHFAAGIVYFQVK